MLEELERHRGGKICLILENPGPGWGRGERMPTPGHSCLDGSCNPGAGRVKHFAVPTLPELACPPTFTSSEKYSACSLSYLVLQALPSPSFGPIQEEGQGTLGNGKLQNSGLWEKGQWGKAGLWDQESREKGDERVRGTASRELLQGPHRERPCYSSKPNILQGTREGLGIWEMWGRPRGRRKWLRKEAIVVIASRTTCWGCWQGTLKLCSHQGTRPCRVGRASWISSGKGHFWPQE